MTADKLRQLRALKGVTQETAAEEIGISVRALAGYERGERIPRGEILTAIADYYGVSREELLLGSMKEKESGEQADDTDKNAIESASGTRKRNMRLIIIASAAIIALLVLDTVLFIVENLPVKNGDSSLGILPDWRNLAMALLTLLLAALFISGLTFSLLHRSKLPKKMFAVLLALSIACGAAGITIGALLSKDAFFAGEARRVERVFRGVLQHARAAGRRDAAAQRDAGSRAHRRRAFHRVLRGGRQRGARGLAGRRRSHGKLAAPGDPARIPRVWYRGF